MDTRKAIAMLAYLTVEGSADRESLAGLFWADSAPDRARATLRRTLSSLRGGIGPDAISADRDRVTLQPGHRSDLADFDSSIAETSTHGHDLGDVCASCLEPLQRVASLYRGDFLGAFSVKDAPEFEDWARSVTESYRLKAGEAFRRLAMAHAGQGDYGRALMAVGRWIALDELHEPAHRLAMLLHAWAGDRAGAIQAYRDCVAALDRELGVPPLEETTELYEAILDEDLPPAPGVRRSVRAHVAVPQEVRDMIDRHDAVATIEQMLDSMGDGPRLMVMTGESWMGKTRLLDHIRARAAEMGHRIVAGTAFRAESGLPYGVAVQLLADLDDGVEGIELLPDWVRDELYRLDPRSTTGAEQADMGQLGQLRLREAFLTLIETSASDRPVVLTIDDAQWTDPASANLLAHVQRRARRARLLTVIATRDLDSLHPALREIASEPDESIILRPLLGSDLGDQPDVDIDAILRATGGIPLLVQEAIESGGVEPESSSVSKYMDSRRRRMSELGHQVLAAAAVLDGMCDASLLKDTSGRTEEEVVEAVEELVAAGMLREQDDGRLTFTLDVLETVMYESTSLVRRRLLHRRAAEAMAARPRASQDVRVVTATADHLRAAGSDDAAIWYRRAGDLSRDVFANEEAAASYELALALGHPETGEIRLALGELAMARGDYETATQELRTAASHA
ncbi:MAG TPA: AAA family ATPase, partial [Acidimicrobiia bacterium]